MQFSCAGGVQSGSGATRTCLRHRTGWNCGLWNVAALLFTGHSIQNTGISTPLTHAAPCTLSAVCLAQSNLGFIPPTEHHTPMESEHLPTQSSSLVKPTVAADVEPSWGRRCWMWRPCVAVVTCGLLWSQWDVLPNSRKRPLETADVEKRTFNSA